MPLTETQPKSFTDIAGKKILDWILEAFESNGLNRFVFVAGYLKEAVQTEYPNFDLVHNSDWPNNNILFSLLAARKHLPGGFFSSYTDTLFRPEAIKLLTKSPHDITLIMDTLWRDRYQFRSQHPESDAEKMIVDGERVVKLSRTIDADEASGEFTGVLRMTPKGSKQFIEFFDETYSDYGQDGIFVDEKPFKMAYLIHLLDRMIEAGIIIHHVPVPGNYHEIDTLEDYELASRLWYPT